MPRILIDAIYINQSGGKILLEYFIKNLINEQRLSMFFFLLDERLDSAIIDEIGIHQKIFLEASEVNRTKFYKTQSNKFSKVFCFANVPPPIYQGTCEVFILFHNALILDNRNKDYGIITRIRFFLKKQYIRHKNQKEYIWIVQTQNMAKLLAKGLSVSENLIRVLPFYDSGRFQNVNVNLEINNGNFLYVADGVRQKNHLTLLSAWEFLLDNYNLPISLHLTVPANYVSIIAEIERLKNKGAQIINHGQCDIATISTLYSLCNTFITPSLSESFGLPIIESVEAGCEVLAADLPYTYDIINPLATFDPNSVTDLAEKIRITFLGAQVKKTRLIVKNKIKDIINLVIQNV